MKIEHIAMYANDLDEARDFFVNISADIQMKDTSTVILDSGLISFLLTTAQDLK